MALPFDPDRQLKSGVHALKQRQYDRALSTFEQLQTAEVPKAIQIKAKMGQVRAFRAQGKTNAAVELCEALAKSGSRHVKVWAQEQLSSLRDVPVSTDKSGFQPLTVESPMSERPIDPPPIDLSGFQALEAATGQSGFQPLDATEQSVSSPPSPAPMGESAAPASAPLPPVESREASEDIASSPSLFQYDALNQPQGVPISPISSGVARAPVPEQPPEMIAESPPPDLPVPDWPGADVSRLGWQEGGRLKTGRSLGKVNRWRFWLSQVACAVLAFGTLRYLVHGTMQGINGYLSMLDRILPFYVPIIRAFNRDQTWRILVILLLLLVASPWLWDLWLRWRYDAKAYSTKQLGAHSKEAVQLLRKVCLKRNWAFPSLQYLPTPIPLIFSYGWLPRYGRLVVSQGLLDRLTDDEIATLYAYELSHWKGPDWPLLSLVGLLLQVLHQGYWSLAWWGDRQKRLVKVAAGILSTVCYGIFWLLQKTVCWTARLRPYYRDRTATQLTGNPNGLVRALGKLSFALSEVVADQGYTPPLIERLTLLLPVGLASTLPLYAERDRQPLATLFRWDALNPWRAWLSIGQPQPPVGDRLQLLTVYARHWRLQPALDFSVVTLANRRSNQLSGPEWRRLLLQGGGWSGLVIGFCLGLLLWGLGAIATSVNLVFLDWLSQDLTIIKSTSLLGLGTGALLRMNTFFPDLDPRQPSTAADLPNWLTVPDLLPNDSLPAHLTGQLLGRPGIANWLGQDLLLKTPSGLMKLHVFSALGPIGNCLSLGPKPWQRLGRTVSVQGWFRRGQQAWIDVQFLDAGGEQLRGNHPTWSLVVIVVAVLSGLWILVRG
ncbi:MAG: M48 family metalloprotease [Cyanobacteria bacterium P01_D01_bin.14]